MEGQGQHEGVMLKDNQGISSMMAYTWIDRDRFNLFQQYYHNQKENCISI